MTIGQIAVLAVIQGFCELLPVSSSAHVILAEKLMGLDPTAPEMTMLLVMLHTGTMLAVLVYFRRMWLDRYFRSRAASLRFAKLIVLATALTGIVGLALLAIIEGLVLRGTRHAQVEQLFGNILLIATGLAAAGSMILVSAHRARRRPSREFGMRAAAWIGAVQGLCLPFRGFSRSGATISTGLLLGVDRVTAEDFSFALAVVLTPPVVAREAWRLVRTQPGGPWIKTDVLSAIEPSLVGMALSLVAGLIALTWLSRWLERGRWHWYGIYCFFAAVILLAVAR